MKFQAIIFDMDGTIIATEDIWKQATHELITKRDLAFDTDKQKYLESRIKGLALHESCKVIKQEFNLQEPLEVIMDEKHTLAQNMYAQGITFIPGFKQFHARAQKKQLAMAIATNATDHVVQQSVQTLQLDTHFGKHIYGISCVGNVCKPNPDIFLYAAQKLGVDPKKCIVIEDSHHGVTAAKAAGMTCIGINTAQDKSFTAHADIAVETYDDIDLDQLLG